ARAGEAEVLADPGRPSAAPRQGVERGDELGRALRPRPRPVVLERVEQVAVEELRVQARERGRARQVVEAEPLVAEREHGPGLSRKEREHPAPGGEVLLAAAVD